MDYANKVGAVIIYDAAYEAYISEDNVAHSIYECKGARTCAIELHSFSKNAGFTGVRLGYTVVPVSYTHLALAVCLAAGIDGIRNKIEPPEEVPENVYELKEEEKASRGIESLPADLHAARCV